MKYYIKTTNTKNGKTMIHSTPVFTNKKKAKEWADAFEKAMNGKAKAEVVK